MELTSIINHSAYQINADESMDDDFSKEVDQSIIETDNLLQKLMLDKSINESDKNNANYNNNCYDLPVKQFKIRQSLITTLLQSNHYRFLENVICTTLIFFVINEILEDILSDRITKNGTGFDLARKQLKSFNLLIITWLGMQVSTIIVPFYVLRSWIAIRGDKTKKWYLMDKFYLILYLIYQTSFVIIPVYCVIVFDSAFIASAIVLFEQTRFFMKSHAFIRSAVEYYLDAPSNRDENTTVTETSSYPSLQHYIYFLFAPTLIYRTSYPRTKSFSLRFFLKSVVQFLFCLIVTYFVFMRSVTYEFRNYKDMSIRTMILIFKNSLLQSIVYSLLLAYGFLHAWLNAFAELLRFGDRLFYKDWWNAQNILESSRKWNVVVHDWLYTYIYRDFLMMTNNYSKIPASLLVYVISALVHEYIAGFIVGFFTPYQISPFIIRGICSRVMLWKSNIYKQMIMLSLNLYHAAFIALYTIEILARQTCQPIATGWQNYFISYTLYCFFK